MGVDQIRLNTISSSVVWLNFNLRTSCSIVECSVTTDMSVMNMYSTVAIMIRMILNTCLCVLGNVHVLTCVNNNNNLICVGCHLYW